MRMPRFRVRTLMAAVAATAVLLWAGGPARLYFVSRHYRLRAADARANEDWMRLPIIKDKIVLEEFAYGKHLRGRSGQAFKPG